MKQEEQDLRKMASESLSTMLDAERSLIHALRRIDELTKLEKCGVVEENKSAFLSTQRQFKRIGDGVSDINQTLMNILELRQSRDKEAQRATFALDNVRLSMAESNAALGIVTESLRTGVVMGRHSLAATRKTGEKSRTWNRMLGDLQRELSQSEEQMEQLSQIANRWEGSFQKTQELHGEAFNHSQLSTEAIQNVRHAVQEGHNLMGKVHAKVSELVQRVSEIGNIIDVIDDISEQTNLLALNASIEAARAGEQGKGFAVVADDIRKLAERSSTATRDIYDTIEAIQLETKEAMESITAGNRVMDNGVESASFSEELLHQMSERLGQMAREQISIENQLTTAKDITTTNLGRSREAVRTIHRISENGGAGLDLPAQLESNLSGLVAAATSALGVLQQEQKRATESTRLVETAQDSTKQLREWVHSIAISIGDLQADSEIVRTACAAGENESALRYEEMKTCKSRHEELEAAAREIHFETSRLILATNLLSQRAMDGVQIEVARPKQVLELAESGSFRVVHHGSAMDRAGTEQKAS